MILEANRRAFSLHPTLIFPIRMNKQLKYTADGLIPAIVQDASTRRVLMMAWMNSATLEATLTTGFMNYWSRSRQKVLAQRRNERTHATRRSLVCRLRRRHFTL
jgi:hypothetical protein